MYTPIIVICSSVNEHLGCFHISVTANHAAMNAGVCALSPSSCSNTDWGVEREMWDQS